MPLSSCGTAELQSFIDALYARMEEDESTLDEPVADSFRRWCGIVLEGLPRLLTRIPIWKCATLQPAPRSQRAPMPSFRRHRLFELRSFYAV